MPSTELHIDPAYKEALGRAGLDSLDAFMRCRGLAETSWHARRTTVPVDLRVHGKERRFYLKRVFSVGLSERLAAIRGGGLALLPMLEWQAIQALRSAELPAMRAVACGQRKRLGLPRQAFLLVEAVPPRHDLIHWLMPAQAGPPNDDAADASGRTPASRRRLFHTVGRLVGRLHAHGFTWPDLLPKHILARLHDNGSGRPAWDLHMIDLERARRPAAPEEQFADLARLAKAVPALAPSPREARCFAAGYRSAGPSVLLANDRYRHRIKKLWARFERSGGRLPMPDDCNVTELQPMLKRGGLLIHKKDRDALERLGIVDLRSAMAIRDGRPFGRSRLPRWRGRWVLEGTADDGSRVRYYVKLHDRPQLAAQIRRMRQMRARRSTARWDWHQLRELARHGIPAVTVAAFGERMVGIWERQSVIITRAVPGRSLADWLAERQPLTPRQRHALTRQLGAFVGAFHAQRFRHRTLDLHHLFIGTNSDGATVFRIVDPGSVFRVGRDAAAIWASDLRTLDASAGQSGSTRVDRLCFLAGYLSRNDGAAIRTPDAENLRRSRTGRMGHGTHLLRCSGSAQP